MTWNLATIHFDFDKSDIRSGDATILQGNFDQVKAAAGMNVKPMITVEGYCDPIGTSEYNMALGMRRADAAKAYMVKLGRGRSAVLHHQLRRGEAGDPGRGAVRAQPARRVQGRPVRAHLSDV